MHSSDFGGDATFKHNGDFSGNVIIYMPVGEANYQLDHHDNTVSFEVPFSDLKDLVFQYLESELIQMLEQGGLNKFLRVLKASQMFRT